MTKRTLLAAACLCVLNGPRAASGGQPLSLDVSPAVAMAPSPVRVRATIEASDENRWLEIIAQSPDFARSSTIELDGSRAPRVSRFDYPNVPPGVYDVTALLVGTRGTRATVTRTVRIVPH